MIIYLILTITALLFLRRHTPRIQPPTTSTNSPTTSSTSDSSFSFSFSISSEDETTESTQNPTGHITPTCPDTPAGFTRRQIYETSFLLRQKGLPIELVLPILDYAEYWTRTVHGRSARVSVAQDFSGGGGSEDYLRTGRVGEDGASGVRPVRRVVFVLEARDQGWSDFTEDHGTFRGSWTWFEGRRVGGCGEGEGEDEGSIEDLNQGEEPHLRPDDGDDAGEPPESSARSASREVVRNIHAGTDWTKHVISWSANDEDGNGAWVRQLKRGDAIVLSAHARFPGWTNRVRSAKIAVYTAAIR